MPIYLGNTAYDLYVGSVKQNVWVGDRRVTGGDAFETVDAGIDFTVSRSGLVSLSNTVGTLTGTNFNDGDEIGTVAMDTDHDLTGSITVPNNSIWSNAGGSITITGISTTQLGPFTPDPGEDRNRYTETFLDNIDAFEDVTDSEAEDIDCSTVEDYYIHRKSCITTTTTSGHTPRYTLTCIAPDGCDLEDGTVVDHGPVETGSTEEQVCGDCIETFYRNPNYEGPTFDLQAIYDAGGYFTAYVNRDDGSVSSYLSGVVFAGVTTRLQTGQTDPYPVLPSDYVNADGNPWIERTIHLEVTGDIPTFYANEDEVINSADFRVSVVARQFAANATPPVLHVQVKYFTTDIEIRTLTVNDGDDILLTNYAEGLSGYYFSTIRTRPSGTPVMYDPEGSFRPGKGYTGTLTPREHTITATNTAGSDTFTFTIRTDALV